MDIRELYSEIGGNYDEVLSRLLKEDRIIKYLSMFVSDETFKNLKDAMAAEDYQQAFLSVHSLKSITGNMSFTALSEQVFALTEELRGGKDIDSAKIRFETLDMLYENTVSSIKKYLDKRE